MDDPALGDSAGDENDNELETLAECEEADSYCSSARSSSQDSGSEDAACPRLSMDERRGIMADEEEHEFNPPMLYQGVDLDYAPCYVCTVAAQSVPINELRGGPEREALK